MKRSQSRGEFVKATTAIAGGVVFGAPAFIPRRTEAEETLNFGVNEELTGVYAYPAKNEVRGMTMAVNDWNKKGGVLGRQIKLVIEDNANNPGTATEKARKLFEVDKVPVLIGTLNSANSQAVSNVAFQAGKPFIVSGGHTDTVTGTQCHWTSFRTCHSTWAETHATGLSIAKKFGKKWYFITPDYAFGHSLYDGYSAMKDKLGLTFLANDLTPLGTTDFSAYLTKVLAAKPDCLIILVQGDDQINCLKQANSFGILKRIPVAGPQGELEPLWGVPKEAQVGYWGVEWYYKNIGNNKDAQSFVARYMKEYNEPPTARSAFGYITADRMATAIQEAKGTDPVKVCKALSGMTFHPLQQGTGTYRTVDHQLTWPMIFMETIAGGQNGNPKDIFKTIDTQPGDPIEHPVAEQEKACKLGWPS